MVMMMLGSVGGRENYYHCVKCCGCYPHSLEAKHKCLEGSMHRECPICLDVSAAPVAISYRFWGIEY